MVSPTRTEVIVTTHANPRALDLCLLALSLQSAGPFLVCVAEDGESPATADVVRRRQADFPSGVVRHIRQPYLGFRKNRILNAAVASSVADYLVFIDGDCLPAPRFLDRHLAARRPGRFLSGGVVRLGPSATAEVTPERVVSGEVFGLPWLRAAGQSGWRDALKASALPTPIASVLERLTPVAITWNGGHASGWRSDIEAVNGFDTSLSYGGEDIELGFRLEASGVRGRHVRYSATLLHLDHPRPYMDRAEADIARHRVRTMRSGSRRWATQGIRPD